MPVEVGSHQDSFPPRVLSVCMSALYAHKNPSIILVKHPVSPSSQMLLGSRISNIESISPPYCSTPWYSETCTVSDHWGAANPNTMASSHWWTSWSPWSAQIHFESQGSSPTACGSECHKLIMHSAKKWFHKQNIQGKKEMKWQQIGLSPNPGLVVVILSVQLKLKRIETGKRKQENQ